MSFRLAPVSCLLLVDPVDPGHNKLLGFCMYASLDQAKISSEKLTYVLFRPELCTKLLFVILIRKIPRKTKKNYLPTSPSLHQ